MYKKIDDEIRTISNKFDSKHTIVADLIKHYGDNAFIERLYTKADTNVSALLDNATIGYYDKLEIVLALICMTMYEYNGKFWDKVTKNFPISCKNNPVRTHSIIRENILKKYKKAFKYENEDSYIAVPLIMSGVSHYWMNSFFEFSFGVYKYNLLANREINEDDIYRVALETFLKIKKATDIHKTNDDLNVGKIQSYKLSRYTQSALKTGVNVTGIARICSTCIKYIIAKLNDEEVQPLPFYQESYNNWVSKFFSNKKNREELESKGIWKAKIKYKNGDIYLYTKNESIDSDVNPSEIYLKLLTDKGEIKRIYDLEISDAMAGGYIISTKKILLDKNVLDNLRYQFCAGDKVLFESPNKLFKEKGILVFDEQGNLTVTQTEHLGNIFVVTNTPVEDALYSIKKDGFYISEILVNPSKLYTFDSKQYFLRKPLTTGLVGEVYSGIKVNIPMFNKTFPIYKNVNSIVLETELKPEDLILIVDNTKISETHYFSYKQDADSSKNIVEINIPSLDNGYHEICVWNKSNNNTLPKSSYSIVSFDNFKKECSIENNQIKICVSSEFLSETKFVPFGTTNAAFNAEIKGCGNVSIFIDPELVLLSSNKTDWFEPGHRFTKLDLNESDFTIYFTGNDSLKVNLIYDQEYPLAISKVKDGLYSLYLGGLVSYEAKGEKFVRIEISKKSEIFDFYVDFKTHIEDSDINCIYDRKEEKVQFSANFVPLNNALIKLKIFDEKDNEVFNEYIKSNENRYISILKGFVNYRLCIYELGWLGDETEIYRTYFSFADLESLSNQSFIVEKVEYDNAKGETITQRLYGSNSTHIFFYKYNKATQQSIALLDRIVNEVHIYKKFGPINVELDGEFDKEKRIWIMAWASDGGFLSYDKSINGIANTLDINKTKYMGSICRILLKYDKPYSGRN